MVEIVNLGKYTLIITKYSDRNIIIPHRVEKTRTISVKIPVELDNELNNVASMLGKNKSEIVRDAIKLYINSVKESKKE